MKELLQPLYEIKEVMDNQFDEDIGKIKYMVY
jgi:hypothetical protein